MDREALQRLLADVREKRTIRRHGRGRQAAIRTRLVEAKQRVAETSRWADEPGFEDDPRLRRLRIQIDALEGLVVSLQADNAMLHAHLESLEETLVKMGELQFPPVQED